MAKARNWHRKLSIIIALPLLIIGFSAIVLGHKELRAIKLGPEPAQQVHGAWLAHQVLHTAEGITWVATSQGIAEYKDNSLHYVPALQEADLRINQVGGTLIVGTKKGVYALAADTFALALPLKEAQLSFINGGVQALNSEKAFFSKNGFAWEESSLTGPFVYGAIEKQLTLGTLMKDLHTGTTYVGKGNRWIWVDFTAGSLLVLLFTGLTLYFRKKKRSATKGRTPINSVGQSA